MIFQPQEVFFGRTEIFGLFKAAGSSRTVDSDVEFPSLEHGRLSFPRPNPTILKSDVISRDRKGKGKAVPDQQDVDWHPEGEALSSISEVDQYARDTAGSTFQHSKSAYPLRPKITNSKNLRPKHLFNGGVNQNKAIEDSNLESKINSSQPSGSKATNSNNPRAQSAFKGGVNQNKATADSNLESKVAKHTKTIALLYATLTKTNERVEVLEKELRILSGIIKKSIRKGEDCEETGSKCGGRISVSSVSLSHVFF